MAFSTSSLDELMNRARRAIPGCVAVGCIDARLGLLLHASTEESSSVDPMDMVTAAIGELFRSSQAQALDGVFRRLGAQPCNVEPQLQLVFALSASHIYVYQSYRDQPELILATVCRADANLGMVLARARATLVELQSLSVSEPTRSGEQKLAP
jgi:hypothetical protein